MYVGEHHQAGFLVADNKPHERPYWIGSDIMRTTSHEVDKEIRNRSLKEENRYRHDTVQGMALLRYFAVPEVIMEIFHKDNFLGIPLLKKICEENVVPDEFEELDVRAPHRNPISEYCTSQLFNNSELEATLNEIILPLKERTGREYQFFPYVTYFPTPQYFYHIEILRSSVQTVVKRFDELVEIFKLKKIYPHIVKNPAPTLPDVHSS